MMFSDRLYDVMIKLDDSDQYQERAGVPLLYSATKVTRVSS